MRVEVCQAAWGWRVRGVLEPRRHPNGTAPAPTGYAYLQHPRRANGRRDRRGQLGRQRLPPQVSTNHDLGLVVEPLRTARIHASTSASTSNSNSPASQTMSPLILSYFGSDMHVTGKRAYICAQPAPTPCIKGSGSPPSRGKAGAAT